MATTIRVYFGSHFAGMDLIYAVEERPLGTGGGVRLAMENVIADHVYVFNGDTFLDLEVGAVEQTWAAQQRPLIVGCEVSETERYGRLLVVDGHASGFTEKGLSGPGLINAGCYVLNRTQLDAYPVGEPFSLEADYLVPAVELKKFDVFLTHGKFIDIGVPEDFIRAQTELGDYEIGVRSL